MLCLHVNLDFQGHVGQDSLSIMIRRDELAPRRGRRPFYDLSLELGGKQNYPPGEPIWYINVIVWELSVLSG